MEKVSIFWFRRDLRLDDNHALFLALSAERQVVPVFIFDENILNQLQDPKDRRVTFIYEALQKIQRQLQQINSGVEILYGSPKESFKKLLHKFKIDQVFCNEDYEPYALKRDSEIRKLLHENNIVIISVKDQLIFGPDEILKSDGSPYLVYSPYAKKWLEKLPEKTANYPSEILKEKFYKFCPDNPTLKDIGFEHGGNIYQQPTISKKQIGQYKLLRNFPSSDGTSRLSVHLRFGTISIRKLVAYTANKSLTYLKELIWREFFSMLIFHFPHSATKSFKAKYDDLNWLFDEVKFKKWTAGLTGFPFVDAGMRELNATGFMHNRVRMVTASFLVKNLHIDWRIGESYFAQKLLDYDLAQNVGNWQWVAGSGADASPYFRVFNPHLQQKKFDPDFQYIKKWVPEFGTANYPQEIIDHNKERLKSITQYNKALKTE